MTDELPVRKYVTVWIVNRKNPPKGDGKQTVSRTLAWVEYGQRQFMSLGKNATFAYAKQAKADKERELNSPGHRQSLEPIDWAAFQKKYLDTTYPGHALPPIEREAAQAEWEKSASSMRSERLSLDNFGRLVMGKTDRADTWCHEVTSADRTLFVRERLKEVSPESVDADLRNLRTVFGVMEEWKHRAKGSNPFSGRKKSTVGALVKKKREAVEGGKKKKHYSRQEIMAVLGQADTEAREQPDDWGRQRLRALIYAEAYTGARINEVLHLEWDREIELREGGKVLEVDLDRGIAYLVWKQQRGLKTPGSEAPVGLPDPLIAVLREWRLIRTCKWVFPNKRGNPWTGGSKGDKPLDQLKALARRAGVALANWKMFRHSLTTHGKQWFGLNEAQVQVQLRHTNTETQKGYTQADLDNLRDAVKGMDFRRGSP